MAHFKFVSQFHGRYFPFNKKNIKTSHHQLIPHEPFSGACAGTVASTLEMLLLKKPASVLFFNSNPEALQPHSDRCVINQFRYEKDTGHFFATFLRDHLKISKTGYPDVEGYCYRHEEILSAITDNPAMNQIILMNVIFKLSSKESGKGFQQDHMIAMMKHEGQYYFVDPDAGVAVFNNINEFKYWLHQEMNDGELKHFVEPVNKKIVLSSNKKNEDGRVLEASLQTQSVKMQSYHYPALSQSLNLHSKL